MIKAHCAVDKMQSNHYPCPMLTEEEEDEEDQQADEGSFLTPLQNVR